jgi:uncharacterized membrane protein YdjX (TVP38/TMEM64 family)
MPGQVPDRERNPHARRRVRAGLALATFIIVPLASLRVPAVRGAIVRLIAFVGDGGSAGLAAYVASYVASAFVVAPIWLFSGMAGYVFGALRGFGLALATVTFASTIAFVVARSAALLVRRAALGSPPVAKDPVYGAVERAVVADGLRMTLLLRVAPIMPQNLLTYVLASTPLPAKSFILATLVGLVPATIVHVYAGSLVRSAQALVEGAAAPPPALQIVTLVLGLVAIVAVIVIVARAARRELSRRMQVEDGGPLDARP